MKKYKKFKIVAGIVFTVTIAMVLLGYGNMKNHPTLNKFIVTNFLKQRNKTVFAEGKFRNYDFKLDKVKLKGNAITKSGLFNPGDIEGIEGEIGAELGRYTYGDVTYTEETRDKTPIEWIEHGGYSADVPEVPASFRHFYDPTRADGSRHLTDTVNSRLMKLVQRQFKNPNTDGVTWALGSRGSLGAMEHNYTWENGKKYMKGALEESNPGKRDNYMAKAWRSLGETLHMIADNGCPPHVRNDAHPSVPFRLISYFGNPDPYEELLDEMQKADDNALDAFNSGGVPNVESEKFRKPKTVREIAHNLAVFTNTNFFTNETITGTDWKGNKVTQTTHPDYVYTSPKLQANDYSTNYYRKTIAGQEVLLCTDTWFFRKYPVSKTFPYLDDECVNSQAKVLIPFIAEAGANVMKLFIPDLTVKITSLSEDGSIAGEITHKTEKEYTEAIRYNGPVIVITNTLDELGKFEAKNGRFSGKIKKVENAEIHAEIEFGGIIVKSDPKTINKAPKKPESQVVDYYNLTFAVHVYTTYTDGFKDNNQTFYKSTDRAYESPDQYGIEITKGNSFKGSIKNSYLDCTIEGERNGNKIIWLKFHNHEYWRTKEFQSGKVTLNREIWTDIELRDIPVNLSSGEGKYGIDFLIEGYDYTIDKPDPQFRKSIVKLEQRIVFYPSKKEVSISNIDYYRSEIKTAAEAVAFNSTFKFRPLISVSVSFNNNR